MAELSVEPTSPLIDEVITIKVQGLIKHQHVTIKAGTTEGSSRFSSFACYVADEHGIICLSKQPSLSGSYKGIKPMGLFVSMVQDPGQERGRRYMKRRIKTPQIVTLSVFDRHLNWNEIHSDKKPLITKEVQRYFKRESVKRVEILEGRLRGTLFIPEGQGPFPGVIDMFGRAGGVIEFRAAMFANRGFISFALTYMGEDGLPKRPEELEFSYFEEAVEWFFSYPSTSKVGIGICGVSLGGSLAMLLSVYCPQVKAVVNINGPPFFRFPMKPFEKYVLFDSKALPSETHGSTTIYLSRDAITNNLTNEMLLPTWTTDAQILYLVGEDDQSVHPRVAKVLEDNYPKHKKKNLTVIRYPNTGHLIEPPYLPHCKESFNSTINNQGMLFIWGGDTEQHAHAQEDSWKRILQFFRSVLSTGKTTLNSHL